MDRSAEVLISTGRDGELPGQILLSRRMLDMAPVGMALTDPDGRVLWVNEALARLLGLMADDLIGRPFAEVVPRPAWDRDVAVLGPLLRGEVDRVEYTEEWTVPDGRSLWVSITAAVATDPEGHAIAVGTPGDPCLIRQVADVTARKRAEDALQAAHDELERRNVELQRSNDELTQFAYIASHDLSEPLRVIAGHVQLLASRYRGRLDDDADRWIEFAVDGCGRMRLLIDDLLAYSRAGQPEMGTQKVDLSAVAARTVEELRPAAAAAGGTIELPPLPVVEGNPVQLLQMLVNLFGNALKFRRPDRPPRIRVSVERADTHWRFRVSDNGIGIPAEYRERVFRIFQRLHGHDAYPGTGIGLAVSRKIVERHGGLIWIEDGDDGGSAVVFTLPVGGTCDL